jgi:hypothetical protein
MLTFTSTIHDPDNRLGYLIEEAGDRLRNLFASASVAYTPKTNPVTVSQLRERGYSTFRAEDSVISSYQTALSRALTPDNESRAHGYTTLRQTEKRYSTLRRRLPRDLQT